MKFEILTAVKSNSIVLWFVTPFNLVGGYQHFEETYHFHGQDRSEPVWESSLNIVTPPPSVICTVYC
jgi:hypothetical protein